MRNGSLVVAGVGLLGLTVVGSVARADDWPQWRGAKRDGISTEKGLAKTWGPEGPKVAWKSENLGLGHATISVAKGRVYGMGLRGEEEFVWALDEKTGKELWSTKIAGKVSLRAKQGGDGSRSTPTIDGNKLYTIGVGGMLVCMTTDGKLLWSKDLVKEFEGNVPIWGYSESPLVDGDRLIVTPGGNKAPFVCLKKADGSVVWTAGLEPGNNDTYSSAIVAMVAGKKQYIQFLARWVVGFDAATGKPEWRYEAPANRQGISCSTPIFRDNTVFAATAYNKGGGLTKLTKSGDAYKAEDVYFVSEMQNHHGGMVLVGDYLYGTGVKKLFCLDYKSGKIMWEADSVGKGSVFYADGMLYVRSERGDVGLVKATSEKYEELGRFSQPERTREPAWAHPIVSNGRMYIRDQGMMIAYDVKVGR